MRRLLVAVTVVSFAVAAGSLTSAASIEPEIGGQVSTQGGFTQYRVSEAARLSAIDYWTPARMAAAVPREMRSPEGSLSRDRPVQQTRETAPRYLPGVTPGASGSQPATRTPLQAATGGYQYPFPFSRFEIPGLGDYTAYPYATVGKIFATGPHGDYVCSGAAVVSANESVVWTAGHCVFLYGWFTNLIFVPGYRDGLEPFGAWIAGNAWVPNGWFYNHDPRVDIGAVVIDPSAGGTTLQDTVGSLGFAWNAGRIQHWESFGYPAAAPFDGMRQQVCSASFARNDTSRYERRPPMGIGCDMTGGSSGGPWILDFGHGYYVNGVNSYIKRSMPGAMFGPYLGNTAHGLLVCAEGGVC